MFKLDGLAVEIANVKEEYLKRIGKYKDPKPKKSKLVNDSHPSPIGYNRTLKNHIRNQVDAAIIGEYDAQINGYYEDTKDWLKSKRLTQTKQ